MKQPIEDYVARISSATPLQLVVISYELCLEFIEEAREDMQTGQEGVGIKKAQEALSQLISALDIQYEVTQNLLSLYIYVNKLFNTAYFSRDIQSLNEAEKIMRTLLAGWYELEKNDQSGAPVMENAQRVYAGLTYTKGSLGEYVEDDVNRGYQA